MPQRVRIARLYRGGQHHQACRCVVELIDVLLQPYRRSDARPKLGHGNRFIQIVVRAGLQRVDVAVLASPTRHHQHRRQARPHIALQLTAYRHPIEPRQHDIQKDDVWLHFCRHRKRLITARDRRAFISIALEEPLQDFDLQCRVVYDQHPRVEAIQSFTSPVRGKTYTGWLTQESP